MAGKEKLDPFHPHDVSVDCIRREEAIGYGQEHKSVVYRGHDHRQPCITGICTGVETVRLAGNIVDKTSATGRQCDGDSDCTTNNG